MNEIMTSAWIWLSLAIVGSSGGNLLLKFASQRGTTGFETFLSVPFLVGAALFGGGLMCYMRALRTLPLAVAYPTVVGASILVISAMAMVFFKERLTTSYVFGVILIFAGLVLLTRNSTIA